MERIYTIKEAKKLLGVTTRTIQRWDKTGKIRVHRTLGGRRRIPEGEVKRVTKTGEQGKLIAYARVSSATQRDDLERQKQLILRDASRREQDVELVSDVGSGLNENRRNFLKLLGPCASKMMDEHDKGGIDEYFGILELGLSAASPFIQFRQRLFAVKMPFIKWCRGQP